jgi:hypothetical protein
VDIEKILNDVEYVKGFLDSLISISLHDNNIKITIEVGSV